MDVDEFSDGGFDDLPDNALQELERNAIQLTQAQIRPPPSQDPPQRLSDYGWEEEDDDLDNTEVIDHVGAPIGRPVINNSLQQMQRQQPREHHHQQPADAGSQATRRPVPPLPNPRWNPAVDPPSRLASDAASLHHPPNARPPRAPPSGSQLFQPRLPTQASQHARPPLPPNRLFESQAPQAGKSGDIVSALQQRVRALESELHSARGEASIIRANASKARHDYESHVARLKKINTEQLEKQARIAEAAVAAEKSASTELQFLQRDIREVNDRARRKDNTAAGVLDSTPKRAAKSWGIADGFDGLDMAVSPTKGQGRGKAGSVAANVGERTPSKGKRKRPVVDSPMAALETSTQDIVMDGGGRHEAKLSPPIVVAAPAAPFEFLQLVLDHGSFHRQPPTFDTLSRLTFPSDPATSLASMIFEKLPLMGNPHRPMQLLVDFAEHVVSLWARCVEEQFWEPVKYLASLISFTFDLHTSSVAPLIVPSLVPVAQSTIVTLADLRRRLPDSSLSRSAEHGFLEEHIDTKRLLGLLYTSALSCSMTPTETESGFAYTSVGFWKLMSLDMVLLLLTPRQKPGDVTGMLELLSTSVLPTSIGPVSAEAEPPVIARAMIERVSAKLTEQPRGSTTQKQRRSVRLAALRTLIAFSLSPLGAQQLAVHENAIPRLVACLSAAIDELYDQPIPPSILPPLPDALKESLKLPESTASADLYRMISQSVLLLHRLITGAETANVVDVGQKLSASHGGSQRYLLALGRLAFAEEDLVIEAGIEGEVVEAAHELLEMAVTPDEGETVSEAFGA
ncbi:DNA repair protein Rad26 [Metarhizium album ARSEF 1941]|uniref:DNA repair protein Rad26 n=1 Tax=Metarhizium album (strain ARSEF 1941) TaxID=1081103 RepID=A0A0B2X142_METAS|nr:DNA repair protein Rad26 [Metarhizium album ARSEF 1941]KHN99382.1 DNA repair protein Rad26 [Metarhizium album ARSEF 1941]